MRNSRAVIRQWACFLLLACTVWGVSLSPALASVGAPGAGASAGQEAPPQVDASYRLQAGDTLSLVVSPQMGFDSQAVVLPDGKASFANVGEFSVLGLTVAEVGQRVRAILDKELRDPTISVAVVKLGVPPTTPTVTVAGGLTRPGPVEWQAGLRVLKALELAGGTTRDADLAQVEIRHSDLTRTIVNLGSAERRLDSQHNRELQPGDSVFVPILAKVTVVGAVEKQGPIDLEEGLRVRKAIELAGGVKPEADLTRVTVVRRDLERQQVDLSRPENVLDPTKNFVLRPGDSVEVPVQYEPGTVSITGAVEKPGAFELKPEMSLEDLITAAGKLNPLADITQLQFRRRGGEVQRVNLAERQKLGLEGKILLQDGDEFFIPQYENRVLVIGSTDAPSYYPVSPGQTLHQFFTETTQMGIKDSTQVGPAEALDPNKVDLANVRVIRRDQKAEKVNLAAILKKPDRKDNLELESGDVIFLPHRDPQAADRQLRKFTALTPLFWFINLVRGF